MQQSSKVADLVFRIFLALSCAVGAFCLFEVVMAWLEARAGQVDISGVSEAMSAAMAGVVLAIAFIIIAFLGRWLVRRIARNDA